MPDPLDSLQRTLCPKCGQKHPPDSRECVFENSPTHQSDPCQRCKAPHGSHLSCEEARVLAEEQNDPAAVAQAMKQVLEQKEAAITDLKGKELVAYLEEQVGLVTVGGKDMSPEEVAKAIAGVGESPLVNSMAAALVGTLASTFFPDDPITALKGAEELKLQATLEATRGVLHKGGSLGEGEVPVMLEGASGPGPSTPDQMYKHARTSKEWEAVAMHQSYVGRSHPSLETNLWCIYWSEDMMGRGHPSEPCTIPCIPHTASMNCVPCAPLLPGAGYCPFGYGALDQVAYTIQPVDVKLSEGVTEEQLREALREVRNKAEGELPHRCSACGLDHLFSEPCFNGVSPRGSGRGGP